ncbi:MAG TPA: secretin N-terminal domain-containing protein [Phycisphaerae bacterium]|jgi:hypothetical protein|nr:secretin N-terminal domain-containing protein [Phycisphaerae bacterium]
MRTLYPMIMTAFLAAPAIAQTAPTSAPAATASQPAFRTHFEGGDPIGDFYTALALRFGVAVVQPKPAKAFIIKAFDLPNKLEDAVALGQAALAPQGLTLHKSVSGNMIVLTVITTEEARQADMQSSPVSSGINLEAIDISKPDRFVTHLLPVSHVEMAPSLQRIARQNKGVEADVAGSAETGMTLILTGPAKAVQDAAAAIIKADKPDSSKIITKTVQLRGGNAEALAATLNSTFASQNTPVKAVADRRTNMLILTGPEDKVLDALVGVVGMEASRGTIPDLGAQTEPATAPAK